MRGRTFKITAAAVLMAGSVFIATNASAATLSVRALAAREAHLSELAYRMAITNPDLCSGPEMLTGLIVHHLTQYQSSRRAEVARAFSLGAGFGVLELVRGTPAVQSGLRVDDEIIAVGGTNVEVAAARGETPTFGRVEGFAALLQSRLVKGPVDLSVRRDGRIFNVSLKGAKGCGGNLSVANSSSLNAWADGRNIMITTAMNEFARSDDELAFVIAHEMAHNILNHDSPHGRSGFFSGFQSRRVELDADRFAVRLMGAAGYDPTAGIHFLRRANRRFWWAFSLSHPSFGARIRIVSQAILAHQHVAAGREAANLYNSRAGHQSERTQAAPTTL